MGYENRVLTVGQDNLASIWRLESTSAALETSFEACGPIYNLAWSNTISEWVFITLNSEI
jgi:hypothetical protein